MKQQDPRWRFIQCSKSKQSVSSGCKLQIFFC